MQPRPLPARIGHNALYFGDGEIAACVRDVPRLVIDDPVVNAGLDTAEILPRELAPFRWAVIIDWVCTVDDKRRIPLLDLTALSFGDKSIRSRVAPEADTFMREKLTSPRRLPAHELHSRSNLDYARHEGS